MTLPVQMAQPPPQVLELIQRFDRNREAYKSPHYNEAQLRREFLDPFFKALGWDIDNEQGYPDAHTPQEKTALERQIAAADNQIDRLVYDLYGLTEEEIKLVEASGGA
jgi:hypothetical protein